MTVDVTHKADGWLTAVLRPAGSLDTSRIAVLVQALTALAASSDMLIIDLTATTVPDPQQLALALREPAQRFAAPERCLLLVGGSSDVLRSLARAGVQAAILTADALRAAPPRGAADGPFDEPMSRLGVSPLPPPAAASARTRESP